VVCLTALIVFFSDRGAAHILRYKLRVLPGKVRCRSQRSKLQWTRAGLEWAMSNKCAEPGKRCGAAARRVWHAVDVTSSHRPKSGRIVPCHQKRSGWSFSRVKPTITPAGAMLSRIPWPIPDGSPTLAQLFTGPGDQVRPKPWLRSREPVLGSMHGYCACGLDPLLKSFTTGEIALRAATGATLGGEVEEVLLLLPRALAQRRDPDPLLPLPARGHLRLQCPRGRAAPLPPPVTRQVSCAAGASRATWSGLRPRSLRKTRLNSDEDSKPAS